MKSMLQKGLSLVCCLAFALGLVLPAPFRASAGEQAGSKLNLRVEGSIRTYFSGEVAFTPGESAETILKRTLDSLGIPYACSGGYLSRINGEPASGMDPASGEYIYWSLFVNDAFSENGLGSTLPRDGDNLVVALVWSSTMYPIVSVNPLQPVAGQDFTVHVAGLHLDPATFQPVTDDAEGATVEFNGNQYTTDKQGNALLRAPEQAGDYALRVWKTAADGHPAVLRSGDIALKVGSAPAQPTGGNFNAGNSTIRFATVAGGAGRQAVLAEAFSGSVRSSHSLVYTLAMPAGTVISGPEGWDGAFTLPTPVPLSGLSVTGGSIRMAVKAGSPDNDLTLSRFAEITLPNASGLKAGYFDRAGVFHNIQRLPSRTPPASGDDGFYDDAAGNALIIFTKHFSTFAAYLPAERVTVSQSRIDGAIASSLAYLTAHGAADDWTALALNRAGRAVPRDYLKGVAETIAKSVGMNPLRLAKAVIGLRAAGADPTRFNGVNLVQRLLESDVTKTGANGPIFALLALDSGRYALPAGAQWNASKLIGAILEYRSGGGFALDKGADADPDITSMAVTALSAHMENGAVHAAVDGALAFLAGRETQNGGLIPAGGSQETAESAAQAVIALCSAGVDPAADARFLKPGGGMLDNLMGFYTSDGGFAHIAGGPTDIIATQQALLALEAYSRFRAGLPYIYDLSSGGVSAVTVENPPTGSSQPPVALIAAFAAAAILGLAAALIKKARTNCKKD